MVNVEPDTAGLIEDLMAAMREVSALIPDPAQARFTKGILERQLIMLTRIATLEAEVERLRAARPGRVP